MEIYRSPNTQNFNQLTITPTESKNILRPSDQLVSAKKEGNEKSCWQSFREKCSSFFQCLWGWCVFLFNKIFSCCPCKEPDVESAESAENQKVEVAKEEVVEEDPLAKEKTRFENLRSFFIRERDRDAFDGKAQFKEIWKRNFEALPDEAQERILRRGAKAYALAKQQKEPQINIEEYIDSFLRVEENRQELLSFYRDLEVDQREDESFDPIDDIEVPQALADIILDLANEIASQNE